MKQVYRYSTLNKQIQIFHNFFTLLKNISNHIVFGSIFINWRCLLNLINSQLNLINTLLTLKEHTISASGNTFIILYMSVRVKDTVPPWSRNKGITISTRIRASSTILNHRINSEVERALIGCHHKITQLVGFGGKNTIFLCSEKKSIGYGRELIRHCCRVCMYEQLSTMCILNCQVFIIATALAIVEAATNHHQCHYARLILCLP